MSPLEFNPSVKADNRSQRDIISSAWACFEKRKYVNSFCSFEQILNTDLENIEAHFGAGMSYGRLTPIVKSKANEHFERILELKALEQKTWKEERKEKNFVRPDIFNKFDTEIPCAVHYEQGRMEIYSQKYQDGINILDSVLKRCPGHVYALFDTGYALIHLKKYSEARKLFEEQVLSREYEEVLSKYDEQHEALIYNGFCYLYLEDFFTAEKIFKQVLELSPESTSAFMGREIAIEKRKKRELLKEDEDRVTMLLDAQRWSRDCQEDKGDKKGIGLAG
jgi:tetratricopeptide (TPR) repeat protein